MTAKEAAKKEIERLIKKFDDHENDYKNSTYNETSTRRELIDPFFKALGWDIDNKGSIAEAYKEVVHEDKVKISGQLKSPDYSFRLNGKRYFFVEAKKPSVNIKEDSNPAYQVKRYAWSAKLKISIVTDFQEFAVYDCTDKPKASDKVTQARIHYFTHKEYLKNFDYIWDTFSKEAVENGQHDKYIQTETKKGSTSVDDEFLESLDSWRVLLAKDIFKENPTLNEDQLNFLVQHTIDRIIFLRIAEDRNVEIYGSIQSCLKTTNPYKALLKLFIAADEKYNSGLFDFTKDTLSQKINISSDCIEKIVSELYFPKCSYEFSVIPVEILGSAYEQFLGKTIQITDTGKIKIEEKPEVRKAGGVFYTPQYIVDYIVENTVGKLIEGKTPKQIEAIKILDPASGSGSFLLGAYQYLLDYHLKWYRNNKTKSKGKKDEPLNPDNTLKTDIKKKILLNNIFGVDLDANAVEVTKLSLLLKCLEGETQASINSQLSLFHERVLPTLDSNIKCGNSLIDKDIYEVETDLSIIKKIKTFDWKKEFKQIFKNGGFDVIIGNPPYLNVDDVWGKNDPRLKYLKSNYPIYNDKTDILFYFIYKASEISKNVGFIVSRSFLEAYKADKLRGYLANKSNVEAIVDFKNIYIFKNVGITTCLLFLNTTKEKNLEYKAVKDNLKNLNSENLNKLANFNSIKVKKSKLTPESWIFSSGSKANLLKKINSKGVPLGEYLLLGQGMQTGCNSAFEIDEALAAKIKDDLLYTRVSNSEILRYSFNTSESTNLLYLEEISNFTDLPTIIQKHLLKFSSELKDRAAFKRGNCEWWKYTWPLHKDLYSRSRIYSPYLANRNRFALDEKNELLGLTDTTVIFENGRPESMKYILALLNSKLLEFRHKNNAKLKSNGIYEYFWNQLSKLPIRTINFKNKPEKEVYDKIIHSVDRITKLDRSESRNIEQIEHLENQIDKLVYGLYGLTNSEIELVEEAVNGNS